MTAEAPLRAVHSVSINPGHVGGVDLVLLHGFGNGGGCFFRNIAELGSAGRTHVVDWRGAGLSGRPLVYPPKTEEEAMDYFVEGGEEKEGKNEGFKKITLCTLYHTKTSSLCSQKNVAKLGAALAQTAR